MVRTYHSARRSCATKSAQPAPPLYSGSASARGDAIATASSASTAHTRGTTGIHAISSIRRELR
jgi:hypothetical protein